MVEPITDLQNFGATLRELKSSVETPPPNAHALTAMFEDIRSAFLGTDFERFDTIELREAAPEMLRSMFDLRLRLRAQLPEWHKSWRFSANGQRVLRDVLRITGTTSEMLGELVNAFRTLNDGERTYQAFTGDKINTLINPQFDEGRGLQFQSGDILLLRGGAHNEAAMARIGDVSSHFSHLGIIYADDCRRLHVVESRREYGAVITPLEDVLNSGAIRASLFRHKESALARHAARIIFDRVAQSLRRDDRRILYDFTMQPDGYEQLFCAKLVRAAYDEASGGEVKLPTFMTRLGGPNRDFFDRIGVTATETFAPGDMEIEPQFDIVAEWRDFRATAKARLQDIIMDRLFDWMGRHGYRFRKDFPIKVAAGLGRNASWLPSTVSQVLEEAVPVVPPNMSPRTVANIAMLHYTAKSLYDEIARVQQVHIARTGLPITPTAVVSALEGLRELQGKQIGYLISD